MKLSPALTLSLIALAGGVASRAAEPLATVIQSGDRAAALALIRAGAEVNTPQADGTTPLHWAVYRVDTELTRALLARGARPDAINSLGSTPLAEAVKLANPELVALLLKAGANVEAANADGETALMLAAHSGSLPVAQLLVRHGANVNAQESWRGQTALMWAAADDFPQIVRLLIDHGARVNARALATDWGSQITSEPRAQYRPTGGLTPLLYAARSGCLECLQALLAAGADVNLPNPDGTTPLMTAIDNFHFDAAKYLLEHGANPNTWDWWGRTPLYIAVDMHSYPSSRFFGAPAALADRASALDIVKLLLAAGVNPNPQLDMHRPGRGGNSGRFVDDLMMTGATPLLRAAVAQDSEAVQVLLDHGALVDLPNVMGVTPFMGAAGVGISPRDSRPSFGGDMQARALATLEILRKAGADMNARVTDTRSHTARIARPSSMTDRQGQTALYGAINWGWTRVVQYLLDHGARIDIVDAAGKTPLDAIAGNAGGRDHQNRAEVQALIRSAAARQTAAAPAS